MIKLLYDKNNTNNEILYCGYCVTIVSAGSNDCTAFNIVQRFLCTCIYN